MRYIIEKSQKYYEIELHFIPPSNNLSFNFNRVDVHSPSILFEQHTECHLDLNVKKLIFQPLLQVKTRVLLLQEEKLKLELIEMKKRTSYDTTGSKFPSFSSQWYYNPNHYRGNSDLYLFFVHRYQ